MKAFLAWAHYLALAVGFAGLLIRTVNLRDLQEGRVKSLDRLFFGDNLWGVAAVLWLSTGLIRAFGGFEKGSHYYLNSHWFWLKMALFGLVFLLEIYPMKTLISWRVQKHTEVSTKLSRDIKKMHSLSRIQVGLILVIPFVASILARGGFSI